ncbi:MAG TPA: hypothetical protein VFA56_07625 [Gaiellaceae bacterium]|nr:hypothetical protein [Gaiellaceae bacterium]
MAVAEQEQEQQGTSGGHGTALKAAAAAAATGAATLAVRKVMSHGDSSSRDRDDDSSDERSDGERSSRGRSSRGGSSLLASAGASAWEAASDALLPMAEDAAEAAGKYLAEKAPDIVRERIVPRFIEAFNEAS